MTYVTIYTLRPEQRDAAQARFKQNGGQPPPGVKMLGRWHDISGNRGFAISETSDPQALYAWVQQWSDLLTFDVTPVLDDEQFAKVLGG